MTAHDEQRRLRHDYGIIDKDYAVALATCPPERDGPIYMVNLMKYRDVARYDDGRGIEISGRHADDLYDPSRILSDIGADIMFLADVVDQHGNPEAWDRIAIVRYPTRRSFIDMQSRRDFAEKHEHKAAGMERTIIVACRPGDSSLDAAGRPSRSEPEDLLMIVHAAAPTAGSDAAVRLDAEGTIIGDGRGWATVTFEPHGPCTDHAAPQGAIVLGLRTAIDGITR
jgi:hypothetical protein